MSVPVTPRMGRPTIFGPPKPKRYQGNVTAAGSVAFEAARRRLAALSGWPVTRISDGDVFEYMALGDAKARQILKA